jgi:organic hydroperoxide reductase OsmC/OhrA
MLTYLYLAGRKGFEISSYEDDAVGVMTKNERGIPWVSSVVLHPRIQYAGSKTPTREEEDQLHHAAHEQCFIANSVKRTSRSIISYSREEISNCKIPAAQVRESRS